MLRLAAPARLREEAADSILASCSVGFFSIRDDVGGNGTSGPGWTVIGKVKPVIRFS